MAKSRLKLKDVFDSDSKIITIPPIHRIVEKSLGIHVFHTMKNHRNKIAQYIADTGETDTYSSLLTRSIRTALELRSRHLSKTDVICLCSTNHVDSCVPFIAALFVGVPVASLDPSMTATDVAHLVGLVRPRIFFVVPEMVESIEEAVNSMGVDAEIVIFNEEGDGNHTSFADFLLEKEEEDQFEPTEVEDVTETAVILFSSGTTGLPKGIALNHRALLGHAVIFIDTGIFINVSLTYATLYWISAVQMMFAAIFTGSARVMCSTFNSKQVWQLLETYKINLLFLSPAQAHQMLRAGRPDNLDTADFFYLLTGGAVFAKKQLERLRDLLPGTAVFQGYGQTETAGLTSIFRLDSMEDRQLLYHRPNSCGRPIQNMMYKVVDCETGQPCEPNCEGELRVKSPFIMNGYYKDDSSDAFDDEGWLRTGDIVRFDDDLCFYVVDRIKEMFKFRSWHVLPSVLEAVLNCHPAVLQSVVIGVPHELDGEHPMGLVQVDLESEVTSDELEAFVEERVEDRLRLRAGVKIVETIPMTPSGKVKRRQIRDMFLKGTI